MVKTREDWLIRWFILFSLSILIFRVISNLIDYPDMVRTAGSQGMIYIALLAVAVLVYAWFAVFRTRIKNSGDLDALRLGTLWGLLCGLAWSIELFVANLSGLNDGLLKTTLYFGSTIFAYLTPCVPASLTTFHTKKFGDGLKAGLLCGILGGLIIFLDSILFSNIFQQAGTTDPQTLREFAHSGLSNLEVYIVGDYLAGMIAHLWIGLITGIIFGAMGAGFGRFFEGNRHSQDDMERRYSFSRDEED